MSNIPKMDLVMLKSYRTGPGARGFVVWSCGP